MGKKKEKYIYRVGANCQKHLCDCSYWDGKIVEKKDFPPGKCGTSDETPAEIRCDCYCELVNG